MELIFCYNFLTSYLVCVCPSKMIQMACKLGTFNAYEKKKKKVSSGRFHPFFLYLHLIE